MEKVKLEVEITEKEPGIIGELSDEVVSKCVFCEKAVQIHVNRYNILTSMGKDEFHCSFCIRNKFHQNDGKHVLLMNFKGIIGYYYHKYYLGEPPANQNHHFQQQYYHIKTMYIGEIKTLVENHTKAGMENPVFYYDPDQFMWFVDFNRIGKAHRKISVEQVLKTIDSIIKSLKPQLFIANFNNTAYFDKYKDAVNVFYTQRQRPPDKRILQPTLLNCIPYQNMDLEQTKRVGSYILN